MANNLATQPNFNTAAQSMHVAADEIEKCSNLPAISDGAGLIAAIQTLSARVQVLVEETQASEARLLAEIRASEARLSGQIQSLSARILATEHNHTAKIMNGILGGANSPLIVLHNVENNPIEHFPRTSVALQQLRGPQIDGVLIALNIPYEGTVEQRRARLRLAVGLRNDGIVA